MPVMPPASPTRSRTTLERVFDAGTLRARLHRALHGAAVRALSSTIRLAGPRIARRLPELRIVECCHVVPGLPPEFGGLRLLHLADLHLESLEHAEVAAETAAELRWDLLVCTGDIAEGAAATGLVDRFFAPLSKLGRRPWLAVLGNHDRSPLIPALRTAGFRVLLNEAEPLVRGDGRLWIAGVDDPATFRTGDIGAALSGIPPGERCVLLAHAPDLADEAAARGCALYLCGHTHGGQIDLPRIGPLAYRRRYPRDRIRGTWRAGGMLGYTSVGIGAHLGMVRVGHTPEITVHELRSAPRA